MEKKLYLIDTAKILSEFKEDTVLQYDTMNIIVAVQGLVNRDFPQLFLKWDDSDSFWLDYMTEPDKFLHGAMQIELASYDEFLSVYGTFIAQCGLCAWDSAVPATLNAALTACGVDGYIPVRSGSLSADRLMKADMVKAEIKLDLCRKFTGEGIVWNTTRASTGSKKCDAYVWAIEKYIDKTNPELLFYTLDGTSWAEDRLYYPDLGNAFVYNHDYAISKKAFVFDVSSYDDEYPCDDPTQPLGSDLQIMKEILLAKYIQTKGEKMITVCGFNPWQLKYTDYHGKGKHGGVEAEWRFTEILSAYNCIKDADAYGYCGLANASVYTHYPLREKYQNRRPLIKEAYDPDKTYILFYVGDYDAAAWTSRHIPKWYRDEKLGKNPLMWCFNPNLSDRIPQAFDFAYTHYTQNDYFAAGDSGAGYNNPRLLYAPRIHSDLPDGAEAFVAHNRKYFDRFDLHAIGFVINGVYPTDRRQMEDLSRFADVGVGYNDYSGRCEIVNGTVFMGHSSDIAVENSSVTAAAKTAVAAIDRLPKNKKFHIFRTILVSPTHHDEILAEMQRLRPEANFTLLDCDTFFAFARLQ